MTDPISRLQNGPARILPPRVLPPGTTSEQRYRASLRAQAPRASGDDRWSHDRFSRRTEKQRGKGYTADDANRFSDFPPPPDLEPKRERAQDRANQFSAWRNMRDLRNRPPSEDLPSSDWFSDVDKGTSSLDPDLYERKRSLSSQTASSPRGTGAATEDKVLLLRALGGADRSEKLLLKQALGDKAAKVESTADRRLDSLPDFDVTPQERKKDIVLKSGNLKAS